MRSKIIQIASILALLLLFFGCGNDSLVEYVDESSAYASWPLKDRAFVVYVRNQTPYFEEANNDAWQASFYVDSIILQPLDSSLSAFSDKKNLKCVPNSEQCVFAKMDYRTPYVKLYVYGNFQMEFFETIYQENKLLERLLYKNSVKGILPLLVDIGQDSSYRINVMDVFVVGSLLHHLKDDGFPFGASKLIAQKDVDKILKNKIKALHYLKAFIQSESVLDSIDFLLEHYDSLATQRQSWIATEMADSIFGKYGMNCRRFGYLCKNAFELDSCSTGHYQDTIKNERSLFNGWPVVCDSNIWRFYDSVKDSMGACTMYNVGDEYTADSIDYFICYEGRWQEAKQGLFDKVNAHCSKGETKTVFFAGKYYYCNGFWWWNDATVLDYDIGICGIQVPYRNAAAYNDTVAMCRSSISDYDETANGIRLYKNSSENFDPPTWHWANATEAYLFRHAGNCSVESDTMQTFLYNDTLFGCTFDGFGRYGWSNLLEKYVGEMRFVEKIDSVERTIYGRKKGDFYYLQTEPNDTTLLSLISVFNLEYRKRFPVYKTGGYLWLDPSWPNNGTWTHGYIVSTCPKKFFVADLDAIKSLKEDVLAGNVPDFFYGQYQSQYKLNTGLGLDSLTCMSIPKDGGIADYETFVCYKDIELPFLCAMKISE